MKDRVFNDDGDYDNDNIVENNYNDDTDDDFH